MLTQELVGADLAYWVARANMLGHAQEQSVLRRHYGRVNKNNPSSEPSMKAFVMSKIGPTLPERSMWH